MFAKKNIIMLSPNDRVLEKIAYFNQGQYHVRMKEHNQGYLFAGTKQRDIF